MGETSIEWTDFSINPIRARLGNAVGHYCEKTSPGCKNCYSSRLQPRFRMPQFQEQRRADVKHWLDVSKLDDVLRRRKPTKYFWCDMCDMFGDWVPDEWIAACFGVMAATPQHTHQVLTKRSKRMRETLSSPDFAALVERFRVMVPAGRLAEFFAPERVAEVPGWCGYYITSKGRVLSDRSKSGERLSEQHEVQPMRGGQGHSRVMLYNRGNTWRPLVHRLVLAAFDESGHAHDADLQGCHLDGDPTNNALWNLRWGTQSENWDDSRRHGTRRRYCKLSPDQVAQLRGRASQGESGEALGRAFGISGTQARNIITGRQWAPDHEPAWPLPGVWLGVSAEDQQRADERIPDLLATPAVVRFVSAEPLLGPIDLLYSAFNGADSFSAMAGIDWVIIGGESGPGARSSDVEWYQQLERQCRAAGVAFFLKQLGANPRLANKRVPLKHPKGGDMSQWPVGVPRIRQFPGAPHAD